MALSAAAVSSNMGKYEVNPVDGMIGMTGLGLGRWVFGRMNKLPSDHCAVITGLVIPWAFFILFAVLAVIPPLALDTGLVGTHYDVFYVSDAMVIALVVFVILYNTFCTSAQRAMFPFFQWIAEAANISSSSPVPGSMSDGGHSENLAALPLLVDEAKTIIICDGGQDDRGDFTDLKLLLKTARKLLGCQFFIRKTNPLESEFPFQDFDYALEEFRKRFRPWSMASPEILPEVLPGGEPPSPDDNIDAFLMSQVRQAENRTLEFAVRYASGNMGQIFYLHPRGTVPQDSQAAGGGFKALGAFTKLHGISEWWRGRNMDPRKFACNDCSRYPYCIGENPFPNHNTVTFQVKYDSFMIGFI